MLDNEKDATHDLLMREFSSLENTLPEQAQSAFTKALSATPEYSPQYMNILLTVWAYCKVQIVLFEETDGESGDSGESGSSTVYHPSREAVLFKTTPDITTVNAGFKIYDYGQYLVTSVGQHYGKYFFSSGPLLRTLDVMLARAARRGALSINVLGAINAQRFAWEKCLKYNIHLSNFEPSEIDEQRTQWVNSDAIYRKKASLTS